VHARIGAVDDVDKSAFVDLDIITLDGDFAGLNAA
jgi:hypothetical protein